MTYESINGVAIKFYLNQHLRELRKRGVDEASKNPSISHRHNSHRNYSLQLVKIAYLRSFLVSLYKELFKSDALNKKALDTVITNMFFIEC